MNNLVNKFLSLIISSSKSLVIAADKDELFKYPEIVQICEQKGFKLLFAESQIDVRIKFELEMRESAVNIILIASPDYILLPDIEKCVHFVKIGLKDLFPHLSLEIIKNLDFELLKQLSEIKQYEKLGDEDTLKFIFHNLFQVNFENLKSPANKESLLASLTVILSGELDINGAIQNFLASTTKKYFPELTKDNLSKTEVFAFLQSKWELFLNGNTEINFREYKLQNSINHLFVGGKLSPILVDEEKYLAHTKSFPFGVITDLQSNVDNQFANVLDYLEKVENELENYEQWFKLIYVLSKAMLLSFETDKVELKERFAEISDAVNAKFQNFIESKYETLFSLSGIKKPIVVSRILEHIKFNSSPKKALFVIDGMNYWQWLIIEERLKKEGVSVKSGVTCAFIPSITAWSRQVIFKGAKPDLAADNSKEEKLFRQYWENNGISDFQIDFIKKGMVGDSTGLNPSHSNKILGIVTNDLDDLMHGTVIGNIQLKQNTELWLDKSNFIEVIKQLKESSYTIFITADHGSIETKGVKNFKLRDKIGSISRSKRHIHFSNESMLANFQEQNRTLDFGVFGLSAYLKNNEAFTTEDVSVVTHGGSHFWEVLVPFIEI